MIAVDKTAPSQHKSISFELELRHAPEKVWRALTQPELLSEWLLPTLGGAIEPGAEFTFTAPPKPGWDGTVNCRFLEIEKHRKLSYTWAVGDFLDTVVTFTLTPTDTGTHLLLVQSGFTQKNNAGGARYGWKMMGTRLEDLLGRMS